MIVSYKYGLCWAQFQLSRLPDPFISSPKRWVANAKTRPTMVEDEQARLLTLQFPYKCKCWWKSGIHGGKDSYSEDGLAFGMRLSPSSTVDDTHCDTEE